jgi:hypothetical protein
MSPDQSIQILLALFVATGQVICLTDKPERLDYHQLDRPDLISQVHSRHAHSPIGANGWVHTDRIDNQVANNIHIPRVTLIKPANNHNNNNDQVNAFTRQPSPADGQASSSSGTVHGGGRVMPADDVRHHTHHRLQQHHQPSARSGSGSMGPLSSHHNIQTNDRPFTTSASNNYAALAAQPSSLELALRQVSGDESIFQSSPTIVAVGHNSNFDWFTQAPSAKQLYQVHHQQASSIPDTNSTSQSRNGLAESPMARPASPSSLAPSSAPTTTPITTTTTKDALDKNATISLEPLVLDHHQSAASINDYYNNDQQRMQPREQQTSTHTNSSSPIEFNNQVIYEGPVTPHSGDYHFAVPTASERLPSSGGSSNSISLNNNNNHFNEQPNTNAWW